jgi:hypothetical protein
VVAQNNGSPCLDPARVGLDRTGRERYDEPVMAIRCSRVFAQTGDQFRDPAAPVPGVALIGSTECADLGALGDSGQLSGYGIG